mgnify:CR=1 FL=1
MAESDEEEEEPHDSAILNWETENILQKLDKNKIPGSDKIRDEISNRGGIALSQSLKSLFNQIKETRKIPVQSLEADIIQLHKRTTRRVRIDLNNYRPISLVSNTGKIQGYYRSRA